MKARAARPSPAPAAARRNLTTARAALAAAIGLFLQAPPTDADWTQFRGRDGSGGVPDAVLPTKLSATDHIAWRVALPGRGLSSPIIVGDRLFITCSSGAKQNRLHILCLSTRDGSKLWEREFMATGRTMCHEKTSVAANTPASDGELVFALFSSNDLFALDLNGNLRWLRALALDYPNVSNSLGMSSSLLVADGTLIVQVENDTQPLALGIEAATGLNRWKLDRPRLANWTSPILFKEPGSGRRLVGLQSGKGLLAVDPATGSRIWDYAEGASTIPSTAVGDGLLFVPSFGVTALTPGRDGKPPEQVWRAGSLRPGTSTPLVIGPHVYVINNAGVLACGRADSGERVWQLRMKGPFSASPVAAGPFIYAPNESGLLQVIDTTQPEGAIVGELDLKEAILSTPSIADNALFLRSDSTLWKVSAGTRG